MANGNPTPSKPRTFTSMDWTLLAPPQPDVDPTVGMPPPTGPGGTLGVEHPQGGSLSGTMGESAIDPTSAIMQQVLGAILEGLKPKAPAKPLTTGQKVIRGLGAFLEGSYASRHPEMVPSIQANRTARRGQDLQVQQAEEGRTLQRAGLGLSAANLLERQRATNLADSFRRDKAEMDFMAKMGKANGETPYFRQDGQFLIDEENNRYFQGVRQNKQTGESEEVFMALGNSPPSPVGNLKRSSAAAPMLFEDPRVGALLIDRERNTTTPAAPLPSGQTPRSVPPAGVVEGQARREMGISALGRLSSAYDKIRVHIDREGFTQAGTVARTLVGETRFGGAFEETAAFKDFATERRAALNAYVKQQTGAQFSFRELQRYESQYPEAWESKEIADGKIAALANMAVDEMSAILRVFPQAAGGSIPPDNEYRFGSAGLGAEEPSGAGPYAGKSLTRSQINGLPAAVRQAEEDRFVAGGGTIIEGK